MIKQFILIFILASVLNAQSLIYRGSDNKLYARTSSGNGTGAGSDSEYVVQAQATVDSILFITKTNLDSVKNNRSLISHTHAGGGSDPFLAKLRLASDVTNATTTPATLTNMIFSYEANSTYVIEMFMLATSAATTTGYGFTVDVSTAVTSIGLRFMHQLANTGTITGGSCLADNTATGVSSGVPAITVSNPIVGGGLLVTGANSGTAQFKFRPEVAASATCKAGSVIRVMKIN